jgi:hypothetical protein
VDSSISHLSSQALDFDLDQDHLVLSMGKYAQLVIGPAGSGKVSLRRHCHGGGRGQAHCFGGAMVVDVLYDHAGTLRPDQA